MRVMVPDALLLSIHQHAHTEHVELPDNLQAKVEKQHNHCPVEDLFEASFQGTQHPGISKQVQHSTPYAVHLADNRNTGARSHTYLRGPPVV